MRQYPIFVQTRGQTIVVVGGGEAALAKLRLLRKTEAALVVFAPQADAQIRADADAGLLVWHARKPGPADMRDVLLIYAATEDAEFDAHIAEMGRAAGVLVNIVDDLSSDFFSAAIVDRDPVAIAIGTEGTAPVLARQIKAHNEKILSSHLGQVARLAESFRPRLARWSSARRRSFWRDFWDGRAIRVLEESGKSAVVTLLHDLFQHHRSPIMPKPVRDRYWGQISMLGIHSAEPDLLSVRAYHRLDQADLVVFDAAVPWSIQEIARREATHLPLVRVALNPSLLLEPLLTGHRVALLQSAATSPEHWQQVLHALDRNNIAVETIGLEKSVTPSSSQPPAASVVVLRQPAPGVEHRVAS